MIFATGCCVNIFYPLWPNEIFQNLDTLQLKDFNSQWRNCKFQKYDVKKIKHFKIAEKTNTCATFVRKYLDKNSQKCGHTDACVSLRYNLCRRFILALTSIN